MADQNVDPNQNAGGQPQQQPAPADSNNPNPADTWFVQDKFKTPEDMKKSYGELEKNQTEQAEKLKQAESDLGNANNWINTVYNQPELKKLIDTIYTGGQKPDQQPQQPNDQQQQPDQQPVTPDDTRVTDMDLTMRSKSIQEFDTKFGIKVEEQKEVHKQVGQELASMGYDFQTMPLNLMGPMLDKAFRLSYADRYKENARQEGAAQAATNMQATVPTQGGGSINEPGGKTVLTAEQKEWAEKLGKTAEHTSETVDKMDKGEMK